MKEFGSDFHYLPLANSPGKTIRDYYPDAVYYACGRQPIIDLYKQNGWKCLWVPDYFCYEVLSSLKTNGLKLKFYSDFPLAKDENTILSLPFEEGDALLRVNYFGLRSRRCNDGVPVPVIEDHTHDLIGEWATKSEADWCIASLRKTMPIAEGGILWSPKGLELPLRPELTPGNESLASKRWSAMMNKSLYLEDRINDKSEFRAAMVLTEEKFDEMEISAIDNETKDYLFGFDISQWYELKKTNWNILHEAFSGSMTILEPEGLDCNPFSLTILLDSEAERNDFREYLINQSVYPAILWNVPNNKTPEVLDFSRRMLSLHCDGRYDNEAIMQLSNIIASYKG